MKKTTIYLIGFLILTTAACATSKNGHDKVEVSQPELIEEDVASSPNEDVLEQKDSITVINVAKDDLLFTSINRGACYGTCPTYKMNIYNDGTVLLDGIRFVEPIGKYKAHISQEEMDLFTAKAKEIEFFSLRDKYDAMISDIPGCETTIVIDGKRKSVYRRVNFPKRILKFEMLFDDLLTSLSWEQISEEKR